MAVVKGKNPNGETLDANDGVTDGVDTIIGNAGADVIHAGGGDDTIKGGGGADYIHGGLGRDTVTYEDSWVGVQVSLAAGKGKYGTAEGDTLVSIEDVTGSAHDDTLVGNAADNKLVGGAGNDTLKGGGGHDVLLGGAGDDTIEIDSADDWAEGGEGNDTLLLKGNGYEVHIGFNGLIDNTDGVGMTGKGYGDDVRPNGGFHPLGHDTKGFENVNGSAGGDDIYGSGVANKLAGAGGNDLLVGFDGDDTLSGGSGDDWIVGGLDADALTGGSGSDRFVFMDFADSQMAGGKPQDLITDFVQGEDKLDLSNLDFALAQLLVLDNQTVDGANASFVGIDANQNGAFDGGEFVVAVWLVGAFSAGDLIL
jgi:Ca2+-binding RTX toxin-like protein